MTACVDFCDHSISFDGDALIEAPWAIDHAGYFGVDLNTEDSTLFPDDSVYSGEDESATGATAAAAATPMCIPVSASSSTMPAATAAWLCSPVSAGIKAAPIKKRKKATMLDAADGSAGKAVRQTRPKVVEAKGAVQCVGRNRKKGIQCRNAALMEYIGPRPVYCAEHIELDPAALYVKCKAGFQKEPGDDKACKEVVLAEFGLCYKHFGLMTRTLVAKGDLETALHHQQRIQDLQLQLEREAASAKKKDSDLYQRKNKLIPKFQEMNRLIREAILFIRDPEAAAVAAAAAVEAARAAAAANAEAAVRVGAIAAAAAAAAGHMPMDVTDTVSMVSGSAATSLPSSPSYQKDLKRKMPLPSMKPRQRKFKVEKSVADKRRKLATGVKVEGHMPTAPISMAPALTASSAAPASAMAPMLTPTVPPSTLPVSAVDTFSMLVAGAMEFPAFDPDSPFQSSSPSDLADVSTLGSDDLMVFSNDDWFATSSDELLGDF
jgi:hypothetical protein